MVSRADQLSKIQEEAHMLFCRKNTDYGDAFAKFGTLGVISNTDYGDAFAKFGTLGVIVRIEDKLMRCISVHQAGLTLMDSESLRDTLLDMHNYAAMAIMLLDDKYAEKPME